MKRSIRNNSRKLWQSASVLALVAAIPASAQTTVLAPTSSNYDLIAKSGVDQVVELSSGTNGYFIMGDSYHASYDSGAATSGNPRGSVPAGGVGILSTFGGYWQNAIGSTGSSSWGTSWLLVANKAPVIKVDSGATLTFAGKELYGTFKQDYGFYSMVQAAGDVAFGEANWTFWGNNSFTNVKLLNNANVDFNTGTATINGAISGVSSAVLKVDGTLFANGVNTAGQTFLGVVNVANGGNLVVGDASHTSAVFGDIAGKTTQIDVGAPAGMLSGYGTIYGNVSNAGIIKPGVAGGPNGVLTINGNLTLASSSVVKTALSPTGVLGLAVNGNMTAGGEMDINVASGTYGNSVFPLLAVNGGTISGSFVSVQTTGSVSGAIIGLLKTSTGFSVVTETGTSPQVYGHLFYANRLALTNFVGSVYDAMAMTPVSGAKVDTWATVTGGIENLGRGGLGYDQKSFSVSVGGMHRFANHGGVVGAAFSYRHGDMAVKNDPATASSNGYDFAVYGGADVNQVRFEGSAFYSVNTAGTKRPMGIYGTSKGDEQGYSYGASGQISRDIFQGLVAPYVRATYARGHMQAASESGSLQYDLRHDAMNANTFVTDLGLRAHLLRPQADQSFKVDANVAWRYDLSDAGEAATVTFANFTGGSNGFFWKGDSKHAFVAGLSATDQITDKLEVYSRLDGTLTSYRRAGQFSLGAKYKF